MSTTIAPGTNLNRYHIRSRIGAGGMGEVYLAQDTLLGRPVALKLLLSELTRNKDHLLRFEQEARATSALNHPNILTIYEIGQAGLTHYIAAEFVEGVTLREQMARSRMKVAQVLDVLIQIAEALTAAHAAGVVHRDIKPENIMLRPDGYVKVLDFGLAKLTENLQDIFAGPEASTIPNVHTDPGAVIGTVLYMSPEQLRSQKVDGRSDIWSLGVMAYEMLAGTAPFTDATKSGVIVSILEREPTPIVQYAPEVPPDLQRIVMRTLRKEKGERYQATKDLLLDLKSLRQNLSLAEQSGRPLLPISTGDLTGAPTNEAQTTADAAPTSPKTDEMQVARPTSRIEYLVSEIKRHKTGALLTLLALVALIIGGIVLWRQVFSAKTDNPERIAQVQSRPAEPLQKMKFTVLRAGGDISSAAISPDGKYIVTVVNEAGKQSLWIRQIATSSNVQIAMPAQDEYDGLSFSPDSNYIYFVRRERDVGVLYQIPVLGGTARKLTQNVDTPVTFSPDGKRMAFVRNYEEEHATSLVVANMDGSSEQRLATKSRPEFFATHGSFPNGPAWSPDGKVIASPTLSLAGESRMNVVAVNVDDRSERRINAQPWLDIGQVAWLADGSGLLMNAADQSSSPVQIWSLSYASGEARRITNDQNFYEAVSVSRDSNTLITVLSEQPSSVWIVSARETNQARQILSGGYIGITGIAWTPDGKIIYSSNESETQNLWSMDADGKNRKQITFDDHGDMQPVASPDGRYIVFVSYRAGSPHLWRMDADGSNARQLTQGSYEDTPAFSPDGRWVVYHRREQTSDGLWKVSIDGGEPQQLTDRQSWQPAVSPDGKWIACFSRENQPNSTWKIAVLPFDGGQSIKEFDTPPGTDPLLSGIRWTPDGHTLTYVVTDANVSNIWSQPQAGGAPTKMTDFKESQVLSFAWSPDGKQIAAVRGTMTRNVVLLRGFK